MNTLEPITPSQVAGRMKGLTRWAKIAAGRHDIMVVGILVVAIFMIILPMPTPLVDVMIAANFTLTAVLLITTVYTSEPIEFSTFPSLLLITTLYRLALTISTSRLILLQHDAGQIVSAFGDFVVGGNIAVGLIVFTVITIVQFLVVTKGAERVAEVSARFTLDGMPGKQMSIDGDMRAGVIDAEEAKRLRGLMQKESRLFGAMDGAMKFVKGDAIASIIVVVINLVGGMLIGVLQGGMDFSAAARTYSLLSVGDGLIAQIPSLIISVSAGIIVTRIPGERKENLGRELVGDLGRYPIVLFIVSTVLILFGVLPGFPMIVFSPIAAAVFLIAWKSHKRNKASGAVGSHAAGKEMQPGVEPLVIKIAPSLADGLALENAIERLRWSKFETLGIALPNVPIGYLREGADINFELHLYGERLLALRLEPGLCLIKPGQRQAVHTERTDPLPFYSEELQWVSIDVANVAEAEGMKVYRGEACISACIAWAVERFARDFVGIQETSFLMQAMEGRYATLIKETQRQLPLGKVSEVLQRLVSEEVSIRDLRTIFETLSEWSTREKDAVMLTEHVRLALRRQIIGRLTDGPGGFGVWVIGPRIEEQIRESVRQTAAGTYSALSDVENEAILQAIEENLDSADEPVAIVTAIDTRRFVRKITERKHFSVPVISFQEAGSEAAFRVNGSIDMLEEFQ
jgi:type III secretion protein V